MAYSAWTRAEETQMFEELASGMKVDEIAVSHNRTEGAIRSRLRLLRRDDIIYLIREIKTGYNLVYVRTSEEAARICAELPGMFTWEAVLEASASK